MKTRKSLIRSIRRRLRDRKGQSTTEYILILAVVVIIALQFKDKFAGEQGVLSKIIGSLETNIDQKFGSELNN